ncbi:MAG: tyrosine-type recombinase/integrase, partial [Dehalococcoidia bacterium]|nr:tyrosine-type recombinase/integrase [Dehalococcoidia bacterium]
HAYLRAWRSFYSWAEESGLINANPCSRVRVKVPKPLREAVEIGDIPRLIEACATVRDKLIVSMLADTGLRLSELSSISRSDMSLRTQTMKVWGKGAKERVVRYGPRTGGLLDEYLQTATSPDNLLGLKPRGISVMLSRLGKATGIKCNAHAFRRTFATQSVRNGLNLFHIQSLLGHTTLTMTRLYAEQVGSQDAIEAYRPIVA